MSRWSNLDARETGEIDKQGFENNSLAAREAGQRYMGSAANPPRWCSWGCIAARSRTLRSPNKVGGNPGIWHGCTGRHPAFARPCYNPSYYPDE